MNDPEQSICPICDREHTDVFFRLGKVPAHIGLLWTSRERARACSRGEIRLAACQGCGFVYNQAFDLARLEYSEAYDNSLHFSDVYQEYAHGVAQRLVETYGLRGKSIVEIGCGKGDFLVLLCDLGDNCGFGFDPSYDGRQQEEVSARRITFVKDFYSESHADYPADLIVSRYVFEHIPEPLLFLKTIREVIGSRLDMVVYFEVPNLLFTLRDHSIWDIIYEHCSYFSPSSLARVFCQAGFEILELREQYDGQFLGIVARPAAPGAGPSQNGWGNPEEVSGRVPGFAEEYRRQLESWGARLEEMTASKRRVVLWGGGAKGVSFLNFLGIEEAVSHVVDINPAKQGKHIAGTGQRIVAPEELPYLGPDVVILMNPVYRDEVRASCRELGIEPEILCAL
ncbi:MAG: class I SAM-dependent methyltransferase [Planctomycetota bacterium]